MGRGLGIKLRCGSGVRWAQAPFTVRLWPLASGASPRAGLWLKGCLPGPGCFSGAGHSFSSSDSGCSCDSPACSGGKQAGRSSSWLKKTKPNQIKGREKGSCPLSAELWQLKSIHVLCCSLRLSDKDSDCLPGVSGAWRSPLGVSRQGRTCTCYAPRVRQGSTVVQGGEKFSPSWQTLDVLS